MSDECPYKRVGKFAIKVQLIPVGLIHVEGAGDVEMPFAEFEGEVGTTFQHEPGGLLQVNHSKDFPMYAEHQRGFIEGEILGGVG